MITAPKHDGVWERRAAAAVKAVYDDADLRLEALQLDLLEPREDGTRWTARQVEDRRTVQALAALRDGLREMRQTMQQAFAHVGSAATDAARAIADVVRAAATSTRDDYTLAGPHEGSSQ